MIQELAINIWELRKHYNVKPWVVVPTNLEFTEIEGVPRAIMGAGLAKDARDKHLNLDIRYGEYLYGRFWFSNSNSILYSDKKSKIICYPTKDKWKNKSDIYLIKFCAEVLDRTGTDLDHFLIPKLGCGLGGLKWEVVKPILEEKLTRKERYTFVV